MLMTFLLFQRNLYVVAASGKGPKDSVHRELFKAKNENDWECKATDCN